MAHRYKTRHRTNRGVFLIAKQPTLTYPPAELLLPLPLLDRRRGRPGTLSPTPSEWTTAARSGFDRTAACRSLGIAAYARRSWRLNPSTAAVDAARRDDDSAVVKSAASVPAGRKPTNCPALRAEQPPRPG